MIREINEKNVGLEERLGNHAQYYDRDRKILMNVVEYRRMNGIESNGIMGEIQQGKEMLPVQTM